MNPTKLFDALDQLEALKDEMYSIALYGIFERDRVCAEEWCARLEGIAAQLRDGLAVGPRAGVLANEE